MNRLVALLLFSSLFSGGSSGEGGGWIDSWLMPDPGLFLWTLVTFFIVLIILKIFAWSPLMDALDAREERINEALSSADKAKEEAEKVSNEYDEMIKKAQSEAQNIVAKGKEAGNNLRDEIEQKAKEKADELLEKSNKQIEAAKAKAIDEIKSVSVDLAIQAASKVIDKNLDDSTNRDLAKSTINKAN
tara:strand:- start:206 stop:769 length:564 start_codon:yes stop_codon:yes gene_type:complete